MQYGATERPPERAGTLKIKKNLCPCNSYGRFHIYTLALNPYLILPRYGQGQKVLLLTIISKYTGADVIFFILTLKLYKVSTIFFKNKKGGNMKDRILALLGGFACLVIMYIVVVGMIIIGG